MSTHSLDLRTRSYFSKRPQTPKSSCKDRPSIGGSYLSSEESVAGDDHDLHLCTRLKSKNDHSAEDLQPLPTLPATPIPRIAMSNAIVPDLSFRNHRISQGSRPFQQDCKQSSPRKHALTGSVSLGKTRRRFSGSALENQSCFERGLQLMQILQVRWMLYLEARY